MTVSMNVRRSVRSTVGVFGIAGLGGAGERQLVLVIDDEIEEHVGESRRGAHSCSYSRALSSPRPSIPRCGVR